MGGFDSATELRSIPVSQAAHRAGVIDQTDNRNAAGPAPDQPDGPGQRQQQEQEEEGAKQQHEPMADLPPRAELRVNLLKKHQRRKHAGPFFEFEK